MTTTPGEPSPDPQVVPSGDPDVNPMPPATPEPEPTTPDPGVPDVPPMPDPGEPTP